MRFTVAQMLELIASGMSFDEILTDYPYLEKDDIAACLVYTAGNATPVSIDVTQAGINLADEISMSVRGNIAWIYGNGWAQGWRILSVGNYSGKLPLRIDFGGTFIERTFDVEANTTYELEIDVGWSWNSFIGTNQTFSITYSSGGIVLRKESISTSGYMGNFSVNTCCFNKIK